MMHKMHIGYMKSSQKVVKCTLVYLVLCLSYDTKHKKWENNRILITHLLMVTCFIHGLGKGKIEYHNMAYQS